MKKTIAYGLMVNGQGHLKLLGNK